MNKIMLFWNVVVLFVCLEAQLGSCDDICHSKDEKISECTTKSMSESAEPSINWNEVRDWANALPVLIKQDEDRSELLFDQNVNKLTPVERIRDQFYKITSQPLQTACSIGKQIGGEWLGQCGTFDGMKYVCLDKLYGDIQKNECLVYSFGIADDWSFEEVMAGLGCQVRAFDPTTAPETKPATDKITFSLMGLGDKIGKMQIIDNMRGNKKVLVSVVTLQEAIKRAGDEGKKISYLKVDIEAAELDAIHEWISSGILEKVDQIGIEFHTGEIFLKGDHKIADTLTQLLEALRQLHKLGFRIISNTPNNCVGKTQDPIRRYYTFFDVVLYKQ